MDYAIIFAGRKPLEVWWRNEKKKKKKQFKILNKKNLAL
jgi:hypothetical protein